MRYLPTRGYHIFGRLGGGALPPPLTFKTKKNVLIWVHLHNLKKNNNNFFNVKEK